MGMRLFLLLVTVGLSLLSCQIITVQHGPVAVQYSNLPSNISPGFKLKLNKAIVIPGETASVHIQDGEPKTAYMNPVENYRPYCIFEVTTLLPTPRTINPDIFNVSRVVLDEEIVSLLPKLASLVTSAGGHGFYSSGGATAVVYATVMYLESETQPDVFRLSCQHWDDPALGEHLSLQDIALALGELITIQPK